MAFHFDTSSWQAIQRTFAQFAAYQQHLDSITSVAKHMQVVSMPLAAIPTGVLRDLQLYQHILDRTFNLPGFGMYLGQLQADLEYEPETHEMFDHPESDLSVPDTRERIVTFSPSILLLEHLRAARISLHDLHWRELEEIVAELLRQDGYEVRLGPGSKDGGKDLIALKDLPGCGFFMAVWQAKKLKPGNKVDISVIRELADTRQENKASKGVIVTTTSLTQDALTRIERDHYELGKVDGNDLLAWIRRTKS